MGNANDNVMVALQVRRTIVYPSHRIYSRHRRLRQAAQEAPERRPEDPNGPLTNPCTQPRPV